MRFSPAVVFVLTTTLVAQVDQPKSYQDESNAWFKAHPLPAANASPEQRSAFDSEVADASAIWVRHWPDDPRAWLYRLKILARLKSTPDQQLQEVGDTLLQVAKEHPYPGFHFVPFQTDVAMIWTSRNIRPEQCLELAQEAVRVDKQAESDNPSAARQFIVAVGSGMIDTLELEVYLALKLQKLDVAESAVDDMKQYVDAHPELSTRLKSRYWSVAASAAEAKGHKPDALLYYSRAFRESPDNDSAENHARQLWRELGGSEQGFNAWTLTIASVDRAPLTADQNSSLWTVLDKPLTAFRGTDTQGRLWTIEDLKGRKTLIAVWASWCRPCHLELPTVQKLFDDLKDRKDVQVLTVSIDENTAAVRPLLEQKHYTFPIIFIGAAAVDKMAGMEGVPRTWIIDSNGAVRFEAIGYNPSLSSNQILQQLAAVE